MVSSGEAWLRELPQPGNLTVCGLGGWIGPIGDEPDDDGSRAGRERLFDPVLYQTLPVKRAAGRELA
jgi:hypothetical protein